MNLKDKYARQIAKHMQEFSNSIDRTIFEYPQFDEWDGVRRLVEAVDDATGRSPRLGDEHRSDGHAVLGTGSR